MKLFSIIPLFSLAAVAPVDAIFGSDRHPTKAERREARTRYAAENGRRRLVMEDCPGVTPPYLEYFKELSDDEKLAAVVLGYSWAMWDADDSPSQYSGKAWEDLTNRTQFPVELADDVYFLQKNFQELGIDKNVYNGYFSYAFWGKLEKIAPGLNAAASTLGFNKETWNTCYHTTCTPVQSTAWWNLTPEQQAAAGEFGYTCHSWEYNLGPSNVVIDECFTPYYKRQWKGLPNEQKIAAKQLTYNETTWDGLLNDPYAAKMWEELLPFEQDLFEVLGYTEAIYNDYYDYEFDLLPIDVQQAMQNLFDMNQASWDSCYSNNMSDCTRISWADLTQDQQQAAGMAGITCYDY